jgi:hypothetical protein
MGARWLLLLLLCVDGWVRGGGGGVRAVWCSEQLGEPMARTTFAQLGLRLRFPVCPWCECLIVRAIACVAGRGLLACEARALTKENHSLLIVDSIQAALRAKGVLSVVDYPGFEVRACSCGLPPGPLLLPPLGWAADASAGQPCCGCPLTCSLRAQCALCIPPLRAHCCGRCDPHDVPGVWRVTMCLRVLGPPAAGHAAAQLQDADAPDMETCAYSGCSRALSAVAPPQPTHAGRQTKRGVGSRPQCLPFARVRPPTDSKALNGGQFPMSVLALQKHIADRYVVGLVR